MREGNDDPIIVTNVLRPRPKAVSRDVDLLLHLEHIVTEKDGVFACATLRKWLVFGHEWSDLSPQCPAD